MYRAVCQNCAAYGSFVGRRAKHGVYGYPVLTAFGVSTLRKAEALCQGWGVYQRCQLLKIKVANDRTRDFLHTGIFTEQCTLLNAE